MQLPSGLTKWVWDQGEVISDETGELIFIEGIMMDFSEYKTLELTLKEENSRLLHARQIYGFGNMVGTSEVMRALYVQIEKASQCISNVLILGETGTGKELCAQMIHSLSGRRGKFVPVNCGAIPEQLLESEFFGHVKGAFSGAVSNSEGFIKAANNGTLFLDEIGELSLHLQSKLLRVLETKQVTPVGSSTPQTVSFRLIAATHQDLVSMVKNKTMRSDLYYRINVLPVTVPPLREREGDIPLLLAAYMEDMNISESVPLSVRMAMEHYSWPGNVRELRNFLERYFTFGEEALEFLQNESLGHINTFEVGVPLDAALKAFERTMIVKVMEECRWRQAPAAEILGLNLRTFQRKLKAHNLSK